MTVNLWSLFSILCYTLFLHFKFDVTAKRSLIDGSSFLENPDPSLYCEYRFKCNPKFLNQNIFRSVVTIDVPFICIDINSKQQIFSPIVVVVSAQIRALFSFFPSLFCTHYHYLCAYTCWPFIPIFIRDDVTIYCGRNIKACHVQMQWF